MVTLEARPWFLHQFAPGSTQRLSSVLKDIGAASSQGLFLSSDKRAWANTLDATASDAREHRHAASCSAYPPYPPERTRSRRMEGHEEAPPTNRFYKTTEEAR